MRVIFATLMVLMMGCSPESASVTARDAENAEMKDMARDIAAVPPPATEMPTGPAPIPRPVITAVSGPDVLAIVVATEMEPDRFPEVARAACGGRDWCQAHIWTSKKDAPTAFPMTDSQVAAEAYSYVRNGQTDYQRDLWDCERYPQTDPNRCMGKD